MVSTKVFFLKKKKVLWTRGHLVGGPFTAEPAKAFGTFVERQIIKLWNRKRIKCWNRCHLRPNSSQCFWLLLVWLFSSMTKALLLIAQSAALSVPFYSCWSRSHQSTCGRRRGALSCKGQFKNIETTLWVKDTFNLCRYIWARISLNEMWKSEYALWDWADRHNIQLATKK
jgi:hypothetical protein